MKYEITHTPSYALGVISLSSGESIQAESGAMVSMSDSVAMKTEARGGIMAGLKRKALGGESFFINEFTATEMPGEVTVAPALPGDVVALEMTGVAAADPVGVVPGGEPGGGDRYEVGRGKDVLLAGRIVPAEGDRVRDDLLVELRGDSAGGAGAGGAVHGGHRAHGGVRRDSAVQRGEVGRVEVDVVQWRGAGGEVDGPGRFYMQTRSEDAFLNWLAPQLPSKG